MTVGPKIAIVGGGITGLTAAHRLLADRDAAAARVTIYEASERLGGWIRTEGFAGRAVDYGPDTLATRTPWARRLCAELGIAGSLIGPGVDKSLLFKDGRLEVASRGLCPPAVQTLAAADAQVAAAVAFEAPRDGMETIVDALTARLRADARVEIKTGTAIDELESLLASADAVILAIPAAAAAHLIQWRCPQAAALLAELKSTSIAHLTVAFAAGDLPPLPAATGLLVDPAEGLMLTACTFLDNKWPLRSSGLTGSLANTVALRLSAGRANDRRSELLDDDALADWLLDEIGMILGTQATPCAIRVCRYRQALPQYAAGHSERIVAIEQLLQNALPSVVLAGAAYRGSSIPQCIADGHAAASAVMHDTMSIWV